MTDLHISDGLPFIRRDEPFVAVAVAALLTTAAQIDNEFRLVVSE